MRHATHARLEVGGAPVTVSIGAAVLQPRESARDWLAQRGYDPVYGARPLKRAIQRWIENPLAQLILSGQFNPGSTVTGKVENDEIVFV